MRSAVQPGVEVHAIDREAVRLSSTSEQALDVLFDGARVWSFHVPRDGRLTDDGLLAVRWPRAMRRHLTGHTTVTVRAHGSDELLFEGEVAFDDSGERCRVVDAAGRPLATDKSGRLQRTFATRTPEQLKPLLDRIEHVLGVLSNELDLPAFPAYGTLLGAVREGRFIGHDHDADLGYISRYEHPAEVALESFRMQRVLQRHGYRVRRYSGASFKVYVEETDGAIRGLDIFGGFLRDGELYLLGEVQAPFRREWIVPLGECTLEGRVLPCPRDPDKLLTATYGPGWRTPDPAFHFTTPISTKRRLTGWFRGLRTNRDKWDRYYSARSGARPDEPHEFARWVAEREPELPGKQVIDLGSGSGADALWFARAGAQVIGLDYSPRASRAAVAIAEDERLPVQFHDVNLAELRSVLPTGALLAADPVPRILYGRFVADAVTAEARNHVWRFAEVVLRHGGRMYLQFVSGTHRPARRFAAKHLLTPVPEDVVVAELEARGARVTHREKTHLGGAGRSPLVSRLVVEWRAS